VDDLTEGAKIEVISDTGTGARPGRRQAGTGAPGSSAPTARPAGAGR
jgi:hypothetical protein